MKYLIPIFLILTFSLGLNAQSKTKPKDAYFKITEGVGIEGLVVGKSTADDVSKKFGKSYKWIVNKKYSFQMTYPERGLSFYICQSDTKKQIFDIEIRQPYKGKTTKGIVPGQSTVEDVHKAYGKRKSGLEYRGVSFYYAPFRGKKIITVVDVVEKTGIRQCKVKE